MARPRLPMGAHGTIRVQEITPGKWRARTLHRFGDGKRRQVERHGTTKAKAHNALLEALTKISTPTATKRISVAALCERFLKAKRDAKLAPGTLALYAGYILTPIGPKLGDMIVSEVTPMHIQAFMTSVGVDNGPGVAKSCKAILSGAFKLAIRSNLITVSPVAGLDMAKQSGEKAATALTPETMLALLKAVRADDQMRARDLPDLWEFMSYVGCRIAEGLALRWTHVDFKKGMVTLGPVVTRAKGKGSFIHEPGKTHEWRTIVVPKPAMAILERRCDTAPTGELNLVFPDGIGNIRSTSSVEVLWSTNRERLGFPTFTSHGFRKTVATMLDEAGLSARAIAEYLGHRNPSMTQDRYMSKMVGGDQAAKALSRKFGVSSGS